MSGSFSRAGGSSMRVAMVGEAAAMMLPGSFEISDIETVLFSVWTCFSGS